MATADWNSLLQQSNDLVGQEYNNVPRVERTLPQLQQYADALRSRTNRFRGPAEHAAATRLLAQQGLDATRLTTEVVALEIVPTIEDVFHADTGNVEEYLQQVEEATLLAAIQEAQQESVASFESYMESCMARDWAANKRQLFGLIAPNNLVGAGPGGLGGGLGGGPQPLIGRSAGGGLSFGAPALRLSPKEAAYVEVVKRMATQAAAAGAGGGGASGSGVDVVRDFLKACKDNEDKAPGQDTSIASVWALLADVLAEAKARGLAPSAPGGAAGGGAAGGSGRYVEALAAGARKHLERGFKSHVRSTISRYKLAAERGADPDYLREVQAYVQVKFRDRGALDFAAPGGAGMDTSWIQLFYALRSGDDAAARRAADRCGELLLAAGGGGGLGGMGGGGMFGAGRAGLGGSSVRPLVDEWLGGGCRLSERSAQALSREAERLLRDKNGLRHSPKAPYQALVCALLAGDARSMDALGGVLQSLQLPPILSTIEDFMWAKLAVVAGSSGGGAAGGGAAGGAAAAAAGGVVAGVQPYSLADLQADINRWPPQYYSKQNREPLLYVTVLVLSLQLGAALRFLWKDDTAKPFRLDAVHMGLALQAEGALAALGAVSDAAAAAASSAAAAASSDVATMALAYGRKFLAAGDAATALYYYWLAAGARGGGLAVKGALLRELLAGGRDFGTLLGGGGPGARGALHALVPDAEERRRLFEGVAYECQMSAQPEEAVELYLAADRPTAALSLINSQMSAAIAAAADEPAAAPGGGAMSPAPGSAPAAERLERIARSGRAAAERLTGVRLAPGAPPPAAAAPSAAVAADPAARRELEAFWQLGVALQRLSELPFIPTERSRLDLCVRMSTQLHPAIAERLQDIISTAADSISARRQQVGREAAAGLAAELAVITAYANSMAGARLPQAVYRKLAEAQVFLS
ncbi:hypothetical protein HXX76_005551 [Chlamydomonas incerta]|uniref:Nuclear pore protein n=1 Tax=Chlamydomonas incerta TaxID=51695 RepID=A0A835W3H2_CHLIN|nr:hypothetical protein HXX76_005551 [Chlamydomonas incerta]|eukprot:KAG2437935.1 hypothetical protein HXX76_005551 [Chlamydomonas incerta]